LVNRALNLINDVPLGGYMFLTRLWHTGCA
jgi:hypothetical protein